jgi:hypothetical protein
MLDTIRFQAFAFNPEAECAFKEYRKARAFTVEDKSFGSVADGARSSAQKQFASIIVWTMPPDELLPSANTLSSAASVCPNFESCSQNAVGFVQQR